jgi:hypothetical protein
VWQLNKTTGVLTDLANGGSTTATVAVDGANAYWFSTAGEAPQLLRKPLGGGSIASDELLWSDYGTVMTADSCGVYWSDGTNIYRSTPGDPFYPRIMAVPGGGVAKLVVDDTYLYWLGQGYVGRVPKK